MGKNKVMAAKHKKARVEAMKECNEIRLRGVMGEYQHGRVVPGSDGMGLYAAHAEFVKRGNKSRSKKMIKLMARSKKGA